MRLTHLRNLLAPVDGIAQITAICWTSEATVAGALEDNQGEQGSDNDREGDEEEEAKASVTGPRLAIATADRIVHLFDESGERRDKFSTKPADKNGPKTYMVTGMCFSPDGTKLAIAQSDNIVFIYKLGANWTDKKSICNKFTQSSAVTCVTWPISHPNQVAFGLQDGKMKVGQLRTNKSATLYGTNSYVVSCCSNPAGDAVLSGHADGSIHCFRFESDGAAPMHALFTTHTSVPTCLSWGASVLAAGCDGKVSFYDSVGNIERTFDYSEDGSVKEFSSVSFSPNGETAIVGNFSKIFAFCFNARKQEWVEAAAQDIPNYYTVSAMAWKPDGSQLVSGSLCGSADIFDVCIRRVKYKGTFEFTYVSLSQVIVKRLSSGMRIVLRSNYGCEIMRINVFRDRYLVAHTPETLLLGDLESCKLSEIQWQSSVSLEDPETVPPERFFFENPQVCLIYHAGELTLVEYGQNEVLGSCRTEYAKPNLISIRINERPPSQYLMGEVESQDNKKVAYLLDKQTARVLDLVAGVATATIQHDASIDWIELNGKGNLLLFRDKRRRVVLFNIDSQERYTLLQYCDYVQWVPDSDVVVAQSRDKLCVWYSIRDPDKRTNYDIRGDVEDIERVEGRTEVVVDEGMNTASYVLDEGLISFGTAMEDNNLEGAMTILEGLEITPETEAMWRQLQTASMDAGELFIAQRCCAALGDMPRAKFLSKTAKIASMAEERVEGDGSDFWMVRARMAQMRGNLQEAEGIFIEQGKVDEAVGMYENLQMYDEALAVAESHGHPNAEKMRREFYNYLLKSGQEDKAAQLKEQEDDLISAIDLYIKGGFPAKAYNIVSAQPNAFQDNVVEHVAKCLVSSNMFGKAGDLYERMGNQQRALNAYIKGNDFRNAVELARKNFPGQVVELERKWGEYLVEQNKTDGAINHFIEAGAHEQAIKAAMNARMFHKAAQLLEESMAHSEEAQSYWRELASHYEEAEMLEQAESAYVKADDPTAAVEMYLKHKQWENAHRVAVASMPSEKVDQLFVDKAKKEAIAGNLQNAEQLYILIGQVDQAINMYKKCRDYDSMIRLVAAHRRAHLKQTHLHLARQLEQDGEFKSAERHFCEGGDWEGAVSMYRNAQMWDDAIRVAKRYGGREAAHQVAYAQAMAIGGDEGAKLLNQKGMIEEAIDYACELGNFEHAMDVAKKHKPEKVNDVQLKRALYLEDEGQFTEAEDAFVEADKPREAIDMYIHQKDWPSAKRVAENCDPSSIPDVLVAEANSCAQHNEHDRAESLYIDARKPELAVEMFITAKQYSDAVRVAKRHLPHKVKDVNARIQRITQSSGEEQQSLQELVNQARLWEDNEDWNLAIDTYLSIGKGHTEDENMLYKIWKRAADLASSNERRRYPEICEDVGHRLVRLRQWEAAGDLLRDSENYKEAIDAYLNGKLYDKAKRLAREHAPQYTDFVHNAHARYLKETGDADEAKQAGELNVALQMYYRNKDWENLFATAAKAGSDTLGQYIFPYADDALSDGRVGEVVQRFAEYGAPPTFSKLNLYKNLVEQLFGGNVHHKCSDEILLKARDVFYKLVAALRKQSKGTASSMKEFEKLLLIVHYAAVRVHARNHKLDELVATLSLTLLRFTTVIPPDRAFYEAGVDCKAVDWLNIAFVMFNRYLDLAEAMEDESVSQVDNSDFAGTEIPPPHEFRIPEQQWLPDDQRETVRDWVLTISMDQKVEQSLPKGAIPTPEEASKSRCIASGVPILHSSELMNCPSCGSKANKKWWNMLVVKTKLCPWCGTQTSPVY
eukprot:gb/GECG01002188.1/.p1 GENE.gb/GECG01002188.1/~~gb/GECG01002188.1/.p1  ORF type:complete len:1780 (+),score=281.74 gb/GECG01002188.1/:1-5340(+)